MEVQQAVVCHAQAYRPAFKKIFNTVSLRLQIVPFLRLACILPRVLASLVRAVAWIKREHMNGGRAKHREIEVVWVEPLIIFR